MKCPYCEAMFPLTWRRYWRAPNGHHQCPQCGRKSRLPLSVGYVSLVFLAACLGGVPLAIVFYYWIGFVGMIVGWTVGAFLTSLPIDKMFLDARYRNLVKLEP
jgi:hypothetical protein